MGRYDEGWHKLREERHQQAVALGMLPEVGEMRLMPTTSEWEALDPERQRFRSETHGGLCRHDRAMDAHIGRLVTYLSSRGQLENTIFIFTSDNGAEGSGAQDMSSFAARRSAASLGYHTDYETLGLKGSFNSINPGFTSAAVGRMS